MLSPGLVYFTFVEFLRCDLTGIVNREGRVAASVSGREDQSGH
jgi:hypothetical protein